jgi:predicted DNA-binding transcriptional regulator AlpA
MQSQEATLQRECGTRSLRSDPDRLIDTDGVAELACLNRAYVRQLRVIGGGPRFIKLTAKAVRYRVSDVLDWIASRPNATSTSELEAA